MVRVKDGGWVIFRHASAIFDNFIQLVTYILKIEKFFLLFYFYFYLFVYLFIYILIIYLFIIYLLLIFLFLISSVCTISGHIQVNHVFKGTATLDLIWHTNKRILLSPIILTASTANSRDGAKHGRSQRWNHGSGMFIKNR